MTGLIKLPQIMKKFFLIPAVIALAFISSCTEKEQEIENTLPEEEEVVVGGVTEFNATLLTTKTQLGTPTGSEGSREWPNLWSDGDQINVNGVESEPLSSGDGYVGTNYAIFRMANAVSGPYHAAYPAGAVSNYDSGSASITVSETQNYVAGSYDPAAYIMVGTSDSPTLNFSPMMGLIQLTTTAPAEGTLYIKSIEVEPVGTEAMCGTFTTDYSGLSGGTASSGITISAPSGTTKAFGTVFTFAVPAQEYASGVRFRITANTASNGGSTDKIMVFAKQSAFTVAAGTLYPLTAPAFKESNVGAPSVTTINSSTLGVSWTGANAANNQNKAWELYVYSDSACNTLVRTISIPKNAACWTEGMTSSVNFAVGGLSQNTTYYFKVKDVQSGVTSAAGSGKTSAFTIVSKTSGTVGAPLDITSSTTGTVFAEDFRELCGFGVKYNGVEYGGCINNTASKMLDPTDWASVSFVAPEDYDWKLYSSDLDAGVTGKRLAVWLSERQVIAKCGYLQLGSADAKGWVLTPAFTLADGYMAKVNVTINAAKYDASTIAQSISVIRPGNSGSGSAARESDYTWVATPDPALYDGEKNPSGIVWQDVTASGLYLRNGDRIMFGSAKGSADANQRILMNSIKVEVVEVVPEADYLISCYERLLSFMDVVGTSAGSGTKSANGRVTHDISLTSSQKTSLASHYPLAAYTGTLNGGSKTITGLTKPFFDDLQGTVKDLNLNSVISVSDIDRAGVGILANSLSAGVVEGCAVTGSLTVSYSASASPNANCYAGGIVGKVNTGYVTDSENSANITISGTARSSLYIGGVVANNTDTANSFSLEDCRSTGGTISYSGSNPSGNLYIGGVVGYSTRPVSRCTSAMTINVGGSFTVGSQNSFYATGGIVGSQSADQTISDCTNSGNITYSQQLSAYGYSYVAGIVGRSEGDVSSCSNSGKINYTGSCLANYSFVGGIIGTAKDGGTVSGTNTGSVTINSTTQTGTDFYVGGVAGRAYGITASNSGPITISRLASATAYVGGIVGDAGNNGVGSGSVNSGDIEISNFTASNITYIGGVAGNIRNSSGKVQASNEGDIKLYNTCSSTSGDLLVGGIAGRTTRGVYGVTNSGNINNAMTVASGAWISIGGIAGENSSGSWVGNDGSSNRNNNTGDVTNTANGGGIRIGGIVGNALGRIRNVYNTGDITNGGNSIDATICVGGIAGITSNDIKYAYNGTASDDSGAISNSGTSAHRLMVAGIYAYSESSGNLSNSDNYGAVTNTGDAPDANAIFIAGAIGLQTNTNAVISEVTNSGAISNSSATSCELEIAGVIADCSGEITGCTNSGPITIGGNVDDSLYIGGVCAWNESYQPMTDCENLSGGTISMAGGLSVTGILYCGGVLGTERGRTALTHSGLINRANLTFGSSKTNLISTSNTGWSCIGGCIGGRDSDDNEDGVQDVLNTYDDLENYGKVTYYGNHLVEMGGCVGYAHHLSGTLINRGNLKHYVNNGKNSYLGGIVGWLEGDTSLTGAICVANVDSWESSYRSRTAGIAAGVSSSFTTFSDCKYKGDIRGVNSSASVGLICTASSTSANISFSNCVIGTGTRVNRSSSYRSITSLALNYDSSNANSVGHLCGSGSSDSNGRTTGLMTNCSIDTVN